MLSPSGLVTALVTLWGVVVPFVVVWSDGVVSCRGVVVLW